MTKIVIDPLCNFFYAAFYIKGLQELYPGQVSFWAKPFSPLVYTSESHILAFVVKENQVEKKVVVDFGDAPTIHEPFLAWCDIYGKVNLNRVSSSYIKSDKIISLGPNYGLKIYDKKYALWLAGVNYLKTWSRVPHLKIFVSKYILSSKKVASFSFLPTTDTENKIYFLSSYWKGQGLTNQYRKNFIAACKAHKGIQFSGGLVLEEPLDDVSYSDVIIEKGVSYSTYLAQTQQSMVVFNTPAYHLCHGWKLGEFLAMGKAIISTPLSNELPAPLVHKEHIYIVDGSKESIQEALDELLTNPTLRHTLEQNAYAYYQTYVSPTASIKRLLR